MNNINNSIIALFFLIFYWLIGIIVKHKWNKIFHKFFPELSKKKNYFTVNSLLTFEPFNFLIFKFKKNAHRIPSLYFLDMIFTELSLSIICNELRDEEGVEEVALDSIFNVFTRIKNTMRKNLIDSAPSIIGLRILNNYLRRFTNKWHNKINKNNKEDFRKDLKKLNQKILNSQEFKFICLFTKHDPSLEKIFIF